MATCQYCGEEIHFRNVDGRCVPIHPGGGWSCGGTASAAPIRSSPSIFCSSPDRAYIVRTWPTEDFTRETACPVCGASVFFVRHNGGSVWFDNLGWPWPKHPCMDSDWEPRFAGLTTPQLGVIAQLNRSDVDPAPLIEIEFLDGTRGSVKILDTWPGDALLGALVFISQDAQVLRPCRGGRDIRFTRFRPEPIASREWYKCPRCAAHVREGTGHEKHCARKHPQSKRKPPSAFPQPSESRQKRTASSRPPSRTQATADRVAKEAWTQARHFPDAKRHLTEAIQVAVGLIKKLPGSKTLRRRVRKRLADRQWAALLASRPAH
jgi:hypothetical protein